VLRSHRSQGICVHDRTALLEACDIQASMSRVGNPYDNAESFMNTLKHYVDDSRAYRNVDQARRQIGSFIEDVYNRLRLRLRSIGDMRHCRCQPQGDAVTSPRLTT
jgi:transposase InsO family protein